MLNERDADYEYREYTEDPLSAKEIKDVLKKLGVGPRDVLRKNDKAYKEGGFTGEESDAALIRAMAEHPTLLQRPILVDGARAALGRPPEQLLELLDG